MSGDKEIGLSQGDFVCLHELFTAAKARLSRGTWDYLIGAAETETSFRRNRQALDSLAFRPRVLRDVSGASARGQLLGLDLRIPVMLAPIGGLQDFDPGGAATSARAASDFGIVSMHSSVSEPGLEAIAEAATGPKIYQLYMREGDSWIEDHAKRAIAAGYHAFCLTVDLAVYTRRERDLAKRFTTTTRRTGTQGGELEQARLNWNDVKRFKDNFEIPLILKGIATAEDAGLAVEHGVDVVYVSNHGGRQLDHGRGTLSVLPEIVTAVAGKSEIIIDGGFLRGTDVVKALALGANTVGMGRLMGLAMAADGKRGVVSALEILEHEILIALALLGVNSLDALDSGYLHPAEPVYPPGYGSAFPLLDEGY